MAYLNGTITQAQGDHIYGSAWSGPYTLGGYYDPHDGNGVTGGQGFCNGFSGPPKAFGFCFGMGMSHQWPAARIGGVVTPPNPFAISHACVALYSGAARRAHSASLPPTGPFLVVTCAVGTALYNHHRCAAGKRDGHKAMAECVERSSGNQQAVYRESYLETKCTNLSSLEFY